MPILNYTTSITAIKTAGEVQARLAKHGALSVSTIYNDGQPLGIAFTVETQFGPRDFQLPANAAGVQATLKRQKVSRSLQTPEQAQRVAWRILKDWVEAQLAIIEAGMVTLDEVMLPYMVTATGLTLTKAYQSSAPMRLALEGGSHA